MILDWQQLVGMADEELGRLDIAEVNLACARGLPGTDEWNFDGCMQRVQEWTECVQSYTSRQVRQFRQRPDEFDNSWPRYLVMAMVTALWRHCGVRYNLDTVPEDAPLSVEDAFIYGITHGKGGICASLPVLYAAIGRRLGYPIRIVICRARDRKWGHCFARWDDPTGERFNIEASGGGLAFYSDEFYRTGDFELSERVQNLLAGFLLKSMTPRQELACFLGGRSGAWEDLGYHRQAAECLGWTVALFPEDYLAKRQLDRVLTEWTKAMEAVKPAGFPDVFMPQPPRRYPAILDPSFERDILVLSVTEFLLNDPINRRKWWEPMRRGDAMNRRLDRIDVRVKELGIASPCAGRT